LYTPTYPPTPPAYYQQQDKFPYTLQKYLPHDQDTFDTDLISDQGVDTIIDAINLIQSFPEKVDEKNVEIEEKNAIVRKKIAGSEKAMEHNPKARLFKGKERNLVPLLSDREDYKVDHVLVYPWAHLSKFLSQDATAADVCPLISKKLTEKGISSKFSPFGWYKSFKIDCIGHEVAELYRDVKLAISPENVKAESTFHVMTEQGELIYLCDSTKESKAKFKLPEQYGGDDWKNFQDFMNSEVMNIRDTDGADPEHIKLMKRFEIADLTGNG